MVKMDINESIEGEVLFLSRYNMILEADKSLQIKEEIIPFNYLSFYFKS